MYQCDVHVIRKFNSDMCSGMHIILVQKKCILELKKLN